MKFAALIVFCMPMFAAVDGVVTNGTSGKPAAGVQVSLVQPGQAGMQTVGTATSDAAGKFSFDTAPQGPTLLQASFQGVTYTKMLAPGMPTSGIQMSVYETTKKPVAKVAQHMILIQPTGSDLTINETYLVADDTKEAFNDPENGTLQIYVPPEVKETPSVSITSGANGMPITRPVQKTKTAGVFKVAYPMKPGETRVDLAYTMPASNPATFSGKVLQQEGKTRLVTPNGVSLKGDMITEVGQEPKSQATIYDLNGDSFKVDVIGTGTLSAPSGDSGEDNGAPQIQQAPPHIYNHLYWLLGISMAILGLGTVLLLRHS
jgi:hypothetical protein